MVVQAMMGAGALLGGIGSVASAFGGGSKSALRAQENIHAQNMQLQKDFAQQGIRWRVEDAKAAGIHPLYALGASIPSFSPSTYIPGDSGSGKDYGGALRGLGDSVSQFGRAIDATRTPDEFVASRMNELALTRGELENDLLRSQIARLNQSPTVGMPAVGSQAIPGQADIERNGLIVTPSQQHVVEKPQDVTVSSPGIPYQEPMPVTDTGFVRTSTGLAPVPSKDAKERIEDQLIPEAMWALRNHLIPTFGGGEPPSHRLLPPGAERWRWSRTKQEWQPVYEGGRSMDDVIWESDNRGRERVFNNFGVTISRERR